MGWLLKNSILVFMILFASAGQASADQQSEANSAYDSGNYARAMKLFLDMAKQGSALADFNIGFMYANGQGVPRNYVLAYMWTNTAAVSATDHDYQKQYASLRDAIAKKMTPGQIIEAHNLARKCAASKFKACL